MVGGDHLTVNTRYHGKARSRRNSSLGIRHLLLSVHRLRWLHVTVIAGTHGYRRILRGSKIVVVDHDRLIARAVIFSILIGQKTVVIIPEVDKSFFRQMKAGLNLHDGIVNIPS